MSSFKGALGIGKSKQPAPIPFDPNSLKRTISRPYPLMSSGKLEEHIAWEKSTRRSEEHKAQTAGESSSQPATTTRKPDHRKTSSWSLTHLKRPFRLVFADNESDRPEPEPKPLATARHQTRLHVTINRESMASSFWGCAGPRESHASDMAVLGKVKEQPEHIPTLLNPKPWIKFRNQQEARQFIRVLPALRESYFADTEEKEVERCGRDCRTCEEKIAHTIQEPLVDATPEVVLVITDETEEEKNGESISPINIVPRNEVHSYFSDLYMYTEEMQSLFSTIEDLDS